MTGSSGELRHGDPRPIRVLLLSDDARRRGRWRAELPPDEFETVELGPRLHPPEPADVVLAGMVAADMIAADVVLAGRRDGVLIERAGKEGLLSGARHVVCLEGETSDVPPVSGEACQKPQVLLSADCPPSELRLACRLQGLRAREGRLLDASRREARRWRRRALRDPLTRLGNRRAWREQLRRRSNWALSAELPLALLLVDIDRFKQVNNRYGYAVGDEVLRRLGRILVGQAPYPRAISDRAGQASRPGRASRGEVGAPYVARLGGDEFGILLPAGEAGELQAWQQQLRGAVCGQRDAKLPPVTVSTGGGYVPGPDERPCQGVTAPDRGGQQDSQGLSRRLYAAAAEALRQAKQRGGDCGMIQPA